MDDQGVDVFVQGNLWNSKLSIHKDGRRGDTNLFFNHHQGFPPGCAPWCGLDSSSHLHNRAHEIELARQAGVPLHRLVFSQQWVQPRDRIDRNLKRWVKMIEGQFPRVRWSICYDSQLAQRVRPGRRFKDLFQEDLEHLAHWFDSPSYYRTGDGRPVIYVWAVHALYPRETREAFTTARGRYNLFIQADVFTERAEAEREYLYGADEATGFSAALPGFVGSRSLTAALDRCTINFENWRRVAPSVMPACSFHFDNFHHLRAESGDTSRAIRIVPRSFNEVHLVADTLVSQARETSGRAWFCWWDGEAEGAIRPTAEEERYDPGSAGRSPHGDRCLLALAEAMTRRPEEIPSRLDVEVDLRRVAGALVSGVSGGLLPRGVRRITGCAACGGTHPGVATHRFQRGPVTANGHEWTHWGLCPETKDPILFRLLAGD